MNYRVITIKNNRPYIGAKEGDKLYVYSSGGGYFPRFMPLRDTDTSIACFSGGAIRNIPREEALKYLIKATSSELSAKNCECGKDKHGFFSHSSWCPKYA